MVRAPRAGLSDANPRSSAQPGTDAIAGRGSAGPPICPARPGPYRSRLVPAKVPVSSSQPCRAFAAAGAPTAATPRSRAVTIIHRSRVDNYLAPVRTRSLPDLLAIQPANGICPGNRGWGRQGLPAHVPWHRTAIRRICTVHRRVLCTAPYTRDLAGAGVIGACSHAGPGRREVSAAAVGTTASASRPRSKGRKLPGSAQCGSPRRCAPSCCCSCWSSSWKTTNGASPQPDEPCSNLAIEQNLTRSSRLRPYKLPSPCGHQRLRHSRAPAPGVALLLAGVLGMLLAVSEALGRRMQQRKQGAEIARSDPKRGAGQSRWCRRQNPPSQAACRSPGRAAKPSGHARQRSLPPATEAPAADHTPRGRISRSAGSSRATRATRRTRSAACGDSGSPASGTTAMLSACCATCLPTAAESGRIAALKHLLSLLT